MLSRRSTPSRRGLPRRSRPERRAADHSISLGLSSPRSSARRSAAITAPSGVVAAAAPARPFAGFPAGILAAIGNAILFRRRAGWKAVQEFDDRGCEEVVLVAGDHVPRPADGDVPGVGDRRPQLARRGLGDDVAERALDEQGSDADPLGGQSLSPGPRRSRAAPW